MLKHTHLKHIKFIIHYYTGSVAIIILINTNSKELKTHRTGFKWYDSQGGGEK